MIRLGKRLFKILVVLFALLLLLAAALYCLPQPFLCMDSGPVKADVIIVLGGGTAHERAERAAQLFYQHAAPRLLVSGAGDASVNRYILRQYAIPASVIELETQSKTTCENARFSIQILRAEKVHSAIIVTTWYHSRRALQTFEHYAPGIKFYSRPSYFWYHRSDWRGDFNRHVYWEYLKIPGYWYEYGVNPF